MLRISHVVKHQAEGKPSPIPWAGEQEPQGVIVPLPLALPALGSGGGGSTAACRRVAAAGPKGTVPKNPQLRGTPGVADTLAQRGPHRQGCIIFYFFIFF